MTGSFEKLFTPLQQSSYTHNNKSDRLSDACINTRIVLLLYLQSMYHPQNFCDISGARSYQNNVADTTDKEIEPPPVDANTSDFSEITLDNTPDNFDTVCLSEISSTIEDGVMTPPLGKMPSVNDNSVQSESNLITPMIN